MVQPGRGSVRDADAGRGHDVRRPIGRRSGLQPDGRRGRAEVGPRQAAIDAEGDGDQAGTAGESALGQLTESGLRAGGRASALQRPSHPRVAHRGGPFERLNGANQHCRGHPIGLRDHVQTLVHAVDKVHVGPARRPEHDRVAGRPTEARVRRAVLGADVGLHLDDAADPARRVRIGVVDQARSDERTGRIECRARQDGAREGVARQRAYGARMSSGKKRPISRKNVGIAVSR